MEGDKKRGGSSLTEIPTFHCFEKKRTFLSFAFYSSPFFLLTRYEINAHELYDANVRQLVVKFVRKKKKSWRLLLYFFLRKIKASGKELLSDEKLLTSVTSY
jgi:hypothetical protein